MERIEARAAHIISVLCVFVMFVGLFVGLGKLALSPAQCGGIIFIAGGVALALWLTRPSS